MLAGWTITVTRLPCVSTRMCRLRPVIFFPPIEASLTPGFSCLHTLAVDDPGTVLRIPTCLPPCSLPERVVDLDEGAIERPVVEIVADRVPIGEVSGQEPPGTAGPGQGEDGMHHR